MRYLNPTESLIGFSTGNATWVLPMAIRVCLNLPKRIGTPRKSFSVRQLQQEVSIGDKMTWFVLVKEQKAERFENKKKDLTVPEKVMLEMGYLAVKTKQI